MLMLDIIPLLIHTSPKIYIFSHAGGSTLHTALPVTLTSILHIRIIYNLGCKLVFILLIKHWIHFLFDG